MDLIDDFETALEHFHNVLLKFPRVAKALSYQVKRKKTRSENLLTRNASIRKSTYSDTVQKKILEDFKGNPKAFWSGVNVNFDREDYREGRNEDQLQYSLLQNPFYSALGTCLQFDLVQDHLILQIRILWVIVWVLSESLSGLREPASIGKRLHDAGLFRSVSETSLQEKIRKICLRGRNLWHVLIYPLGWGALLACPTDIAISV